MNVLPVLIAVAAVVVLIIILKLVRVRADGGTGYESRGVLFTPAERSFMGVLEQALDSRYRVFGKIRLGDLVKPARGLSNSKRAAAQNKINQKHVDFVVCTANELALVGVLELDDTSHLRRDRAERDRFVDQVLAAAGIPILRFPAKKGYGVQEVRARLAEMMSANAKSGAVAAPVKNAAPAVPLAPVSAKHAPSTPDGDPALCPQCSAQMVRRQAVRGLNAGKYFWTCSTYPACRQMAEVGEG